MWPQKSTHGSWAGWRHLVLPMAEVAHFWIANAVYPAFVLSAVLASLAETGAYRCGFQPR